MFWTGLDCCGIPTKNAPPSEESGAFQLVHLTGRKKPYTGGNYFLGEIMDSLQISMLIIGAFALLTLSRVVWELATRNTRTGLDDVWKNADVSGWGHRKD